MKWQILLLGLEPITAEELLRQYDKGKRKFRSIYLANQSLRGKELSGINFLHSTIQGCDFQDTNLENSTFTKSNIGISPRQHLLMTVYTHIEIDDIPFSDADFLLSLPFPIVWTMGLLLIFIAISIPIAEGAVSILGGFLSGVIGILIISTLLIMDIRRTILEYKKRRRKSTCNNFIRSNLNNACFEESHIENCDFSYTKSSSISINRCSVRHSKFLDFSFKEISLRHSLLSFVEFPISISEKALRLLTTLDGRNEDYQGYNLSGFNLADAKLQGADLSNAKLVSANLEKASLHSSKLNNCDMRNANLNFAQLEGADLFAADLSAASLVGANLERANLAASRVIGVNFSDANLSGACISDWQMSNANFKNIKCNHIYLEFSYRDQQYMTRVPANENDYLKDKEFEDNISQVYSMMAQVLQYGSEYASEIKRELQLIEDLSPNKQGFQVSLDRLKILVDSFDKKISNLPGNPIVIQQLLNNIGGNFSMPGNFVKNSGDNSHDNIIQADTISGNARVNQSTSASWSPQEENTKGDILKSLDQILGLIATSDLAEAEKKEAASYIEAAKQETQKETPKQERIAGNLKWFKETLESLDTATDSAKNLMGKLKGPWSVLVKAAGLTIPFLP
ncbi:pentapeptide repeat-containing protein [Leptolyngbya sp. PCC 6406]|uniref:pentapeptide repeat-containing protein n=1 Tax=Leptolyngbya sp. PCC 6406 TaxID=1173264 RepID=UPI0002AC41E6|nr:pentapeptide repeat-containing protein [Leptolyngbya sp. PCC 6406]